MVVGIQVIIAVIARISVSTLKNKKVPKVATIARHRVIRKINMIMHKNVGDRKELLRADLNTSLNLTLMRQ
jgi:hypothetical protein